MRVLPHWSFCWGTTDLASFIMPFSGQHHHHFKQYMTFIPLEQKKVTVTFFCNACTSTLVRGYDGINPEKKLSCPEQKAFCRLLDVNIIFHADF